MSVASVCIYVFRLFVFQVIKCKQHEWIIKLSVFMNTRIALTHTSHTDAQPNGTALCHCLRAHWYGVRGNSIQKKTTETKWKLGLMPNISAICWAFGAFTNSFQFEYFMVGLALTKRLQYAHLFVQFYGRNARPEEFGFILGDYIVYTLFSISLHTAYDKLQQRLERFSDSKISLRACHWLTIVVCGI